MSIWGDVVRIGAAVASGGLSEAVRSAASGSETGTGTAEPDAPTAPHSGGGFFPSGIGQLVGLGAVKPAAPCCRYELNPPFLLDQQTGNVWRYDDDKHKFVKVEFALPPAAKSFENLIAAKVTVDLRSKLQSEQIYTNRAEMEHLKPFVDAHLQALDAHLEDLRNPGN